MKINCGTDIVEITRIKECIEEFGEKFLNKVFTEKEIEYCESKKKQKYQSYAGRFAAKEAAYKAVSTFIDKKDITWKDFEITNTNEGKPTIEIKCLEKSKIESIDISISHCKLYATANIVVIYSF